MRLSLLSLLFTLNISLLHAQANKVDDATIVSILVKKANEKMVMDGQLDEQVWQDAPFATNFSQYIPYDTISALGETEIKMAFDDKNLYVAIKMYTSGRKYVINSLKRDYGFFGNDNVSLLFDTFADKTNAFMFGMNPYGVRREALITGGGRQRGSFTPSWDNKWFGDAKMYDNYWIAEMTIPFNTLRFKAGATKWRFNSYRFDTQHNEVTSWIQMPRNQIISHLGYMGEMIFEEPLKKQKRNISLIPYASGGIARDFEDITETQAATTYGFGGDAKIAITSGLNLDLTINPDFSQVEVDRQVTNVGRFEIFFPERRQFFLENADLFSDFGIGSMRPFFSRRIGVAIDTATGINVQNRIIYGARLSGKINERLRVGLLNMQTASQPENDLPSFNYTVAAVEQNVFDRSSIAFIMVNKQAIGAENLGGSYESYNRVVGLEYRLASKDNRWTGKTTYQQVLSPTDDEQKFAHFTQVEFNERAYRFEWAHLLVGEGFQPEVGFVPRRDILLMSPEVGFNFFPKKGNITRHQLNFDYREIYKLGKDDNEIITDFSFIERGAEASWEMNFLNSSRLSFYSEYQDLTLLSDFDPTRVQEDSIFLAAGSSYRFTDVSINYRSDNRQRFYFNVQPQYGQFYNGTRTSIRGQLTYRFQPYGLISLNANYNYLKLEAPFVPTNLWLIGPRIDLTFSKTLFLSTFVQYNNQLDNLNINARFQWRFQPASDFFIVYTDNYITDPFDQFSVRNRAFVAKFTYWINL